jgi:membrane fusion protein (multidrug efflux system)
MNTAPDAAVPVASSHRRRVLLIVTGVFLLMAVAALLWWKFVLSVRETTTDAYVAGHQVNISAQVPGTVVAVMVEDTQLVRTGDVLVQLDPVDAATNLQRATSALASAVRGVRAQQATAAQGDALVITRRADLDSAQATLARREPLAAEHAVSNEELADARTAVGRATAALQQAEAQSRGAHAAVDGVAVADNPVVLQARSVFREAWIAAQRNTIVAPVSGRVAQRVVQVGQHVQPGQSLLVLIPEDEMWVDANFRETQLKHLRIGQRASVVADVYGSAVQFHGRVAGVSAGTGAAFALLPPQNASGNWIKVIQRVPVRIVLDRTELAQHPLRIGLSTEVRVDLVAPPEPALATAESAASDTRVYELDLAQVDAEADAIIAANLHGAR